MCVGLIDLDDSMRSLGLSLYMGVTNVKIINIKMLVYSINICGITNLFSCIVYFNQFFLFLNIKMCIPKDFFGTNQIDVKFSYIQSFCSFVFLFVLLCFNLNK